MDRITQILSPYVSSERRARIEHTLSNRTRDVALILEDVSSDHNASAVLRTAEALGIVEVHSIERTQPFRVSRKVAKGAHKWLELRRYRSAEEAYAQVKSEGYEVWASAVRGASRPVSRVPVDRKIALVFGNEHEGLSPEAFELADGCFHVPMGGFVESLNISVAAAISMYALMTRKQKASGLSPLSDRERRSFRAKWYALSVRAAPQLLAREGLTMPSIEAYDDEGDTVFFSSHREASASPLGKDQGTERSGHE